MRRLVLITTVAFIAGLFTVSQGLGAGEYGQDKVSEDVGMDRGMTDMDQGKDSSKLGKYDRDQSVAGVQLDSSQITEVQKLLKEKGYNPGAADGLMGPHTRKALSNYQEAKGLAATGEPTEETLRSLAPDAETQELLGLSPEFGQDKMKQGPMQHEQMREPMQQEQPYEGSRDGALSPSEPADTY